MSQVVKFQRGCVGDNLQKLGHQIVKRQNKNNSELSLINEKEPLLRYVDLIIKYAVKTGDFGQYTNVNIVASALGDFMVNVITEYKKAALYKNTYKMEDIITNTAEEIIGFISVLSKYTVCLEDIEKKKELIIGLGDLFTERYNDHFFKTVTQDTYDIDNERVYWEMIKYKMHSIYEKNMKTVLKINEQPKIGWFQKLFIKDVQREETQIDHRKIINQLCIQKEPTRCMIDDKPTRPADVVTSRDEGTKTLYQRRMQVRRAHLNLAKLQIRTKQF